MVALLVLLTIITLLTVDYAWQRRSVRTEAPAAARGGIPARRQVSGIDSVPAGLFLGPGHTWVHLEPTGVMKVGADRLPAALLGGLDRVELLSPGTELRRGDAFAVLRRGNRTMSLRSPVDGVITAVNAGLGADAAALATEPFESWIYRLTPARIAESLKPMFVAEDATAWMRRELGRLRDYLSGLMNGARPALATLPDGGLPIDGLAAHLGDEEWRQLTSRFFEIVEPRDVETV